MNEIIAIIGDYRHPERFEEAAKKISITGASVYNLTIYNHLPVGEAQENRNIDIEIANRVFVLRDWKNSLDARINLTHAMRFVEKRVYYEEMGEYEKLIGDLQKPCACFPG